MFGEIKEKIRMPALFILLILSAVLIIWSMKMKPVIPESSEAISIEVSISPTVTATVQTVDITPSFLKLPAGSTGGFKAIESIDSIRDKNSKQYAMKPFYRTDSLGFMRFNNYYVIAIGQFYSNRIGECFRVVFEERTILCIVGDVKRIEDTVDGMYCRENGSIIEFIINPDVMSADIQFGGNISTLGMGGKLVSIEAEIMEE